MPQRSTGFYSDQSGETLVNFESGQKGVRVRSLIPKSVQGEKFDDFDVSGYFNLAQLVLVTPEDLQTFTQALNFKGVSKSRPKKGTLPPINPAGLTLCRPNGDLDPERTTELFKVVAAYWEHKDEMGLELGYVAAIWKRSNSAEAVIKFIRGNTRKNPETGEPELVFPKSTSEEQLIGALLPADIPISQVTKATLETLVEWISSVPRDHEQYEDQKRRAKDIVFLGLADSSGKIEKATAHMARDYIWQRIDQPANFKALWRHLQASYGRFPAHDPKANYGVYNERIAGFYDDGADNITFAKAVLELAQSEISVPTKPLCGAAWMLWELDQSGQQRPAVEAVFNADLQNWMAPDGVMQFMRQIFKDQFYGTGEAELEAYLADNGAPGTLRQLKSFFGQQDKTKVLREFGVINAQGKWNEVGFQRQQALAREAHEKDIPPSFEWMRWHLHRRHHADQPVALAWALMDDHLNRPLFAGGSKVSMDGAYGKK